MKSEHEIGQAVLDLFTDDSGLQVLRAELAKLYRRREHANTERNYPLRGAFVTSDDARSLMGKLGISFASNSRLGALFRSKEWEPTGHRIHSTVEGSHGRSVMAWRLK